MKMIVDNQSSVADANALFAIGHLFEMEPIEGLTRDGAGFELNIGVNRVDAWVGFNKKSIRISLRDTKKETK